VARPTEARREAADDMNSIGARTGGTGETGPIVGVAGMPPARAEADGTTHAQRRSLRLRLALWYGALVALALMLFAGLILLLASDALYGSVDVAVAAESHGVLAQVQRELTPDPPSWPAQLTLPGLDAFRDPGVTVEVRDAPGQIRYRSGGAPTLSIPTSAMSEVRAGQSVWYTTRVDGERIRVLVAPVRATAGGPVIGTLLVGKSLADVDTTIALLRTLLAALGLVILSGALAGGWGIASRVLRPLSEIGATARAIAATTARGTRLGNLSRRVRRPPGHDEMAQVVDTFNEMLDALESATQVQRRFVADASHELRAPLTIMQGNLAFLLRHADELPPDERRTMLSDAHNETLRLARLVDDLLLLARADASADTASSPGADMPAGAGTPARPDATADADGQRHRVAPPVELDRAILQLVRQLRGRLAAEGSRLRLEVGRVEPVRVRGDEQTLRRLALILLDNAIKYTPPGTQEQPGRIVVSLERAKGEAILRVRDTGIGLEQNDLAHIFERFYRADRARDRQGTGLGLAIAQTLTDRLGGRIWAESSPGHGSTFSVALPLAGDL
jgi:two-component system, OmpR family, sensor kinase